MNSLVGLLLLCQTGCQVVGIKDIGETSYVYLQWGKTGVNCLQLELTGVRGKVKSVVNIDIKHKLCSTIELLQ